MQSKGERVREVDWVQSAGMLVRKDAFEQVGPLDPAFFVYSDEVDWQKRARDAGWSVLYVPQARIIHREQLSHGPAARPRIVEFSRNRDLFVRKHRGAAVAVAGARPDGRHLRRCARSQPWSCRDTARGATWPTPPARSSRAAARGLREAAEAYNRKLEAVEKGR